MSDRPDGLKYAASHEWVRDEGGVATVGISDFAVAELTDLVYMELPEVGAAVTKGASFGQVESVKAVSDLYAPVSGEVVEVNDELPDDLGRLSDDAFSAGWIAKIKMSDPAELGQLMDGEAYAASIA